MNIRIVVLCTVVLVSVFSSAAMAQSVWMTGPMAYRVYRPVVMAYSPVISAPAPVTMYSPVVTPGPGVVTYSPVMAPAPVVTYRAPVMAYSPVVTTYYAPGFTTVGRPVYVRSRVRTRLYVPGQPVRNTLRAVFR